jgi:drug/metabolite transporter (DMT)-like permease
MAAPRAIPSENVPMMNRPMLGLLAGAVLGVLDGLSALVTSPEMTEQIGGIVVGSSVKGLVAGVLVGLIARRFRTPATGLALGTAIAAAVTFPIAHMNATHYARPDYYWKIMLPGALVGAIVGYVVVRYGKAKPTPAATPEVAR